ncbi:MAG TPA: GxxExxY protein [Thiotrichaceae bacterium]|nr:GxxExxY protein [Thiotrichaceae bacterium]
MRLIYEDLTYQIRGFCYQTYNSLGPGFNEKLYQEICFSKCLDAGIEAKKEHDISVIYKGHEIATLSLDLFVQKATDAWRIRWAYGITRLSLSSRRLI